MNILKAYLDPCLAAPCFLFAGYSWLQRRMLESQDSLRTELTVAVISAAPFKFNGPLGTTVVANT